MKINVSFDLEHLRARTLREAKNLAYATSQALNATAKDVQSAERIHLDRTYHLRKAGFMYRLVKIFRFSNVRQGVPFVELGIDQKPRVLLNIFEEGGRREPVKGANVAVPITGSQARPSEMSTIPDALTFRKMKFRKHATKAGKPQWKGENRTFLIPGKGVFQRTGQPQKTNRRAKSFVGDRGRVLRQSNLVKLLYKLVPSGTMKRLPANLRFGRIARDQLQQQFSAHLVRNHTRFRM